MHKYTQSELAKFTKPKLISLLAKEGIEASPSQKKSELVKLLVLANKANEPTKVNFASVSPIQKRRIFAVFIITLIIGAGVFLYFMNDTFKQNVNFLAFNIFGVGEHPNEEVKTEGPTIYEKNGKTYVVYDFPIIRVKVVTDTSCKRAECDLNNYYSQITKNITPLVKFDEVDLDSREGRSLLEKFEVNLLPVFIFDKHVEKVENFENNNRFFSLIKDKYTLQVTPLVAIEGPNIDNARVIGPNETNEAPLNIVLFTSFSSPHSKDSAPVVQELINTYGKNLNMSFKYTYTGDNDLLASVAAECAAEQDNFLGMHNLLFERQDDWTTVSPTTLASRFTSYAGEMDLDTNEFRNCFVNSNEKKEMIEEHNLEATDLVVTGTPTYFVNNHILAGAYPVESLIEIIGGILETQNINLLPNEVVDPTQLTDEE